MIFRVDYSMPVDNVTAAQERFATMEEKWDGVTLIGRWHEAGNRGFMVVKLKTLCLLANILTNGQTFATSASFL